MFEYKEELWGMLPNGEEVKLIELSNEELTVRITNYGGRIISIIRKGIDLVCGPKTFDALMEDTCYCGAICGRVANRICQGKFDLDDISYELPINNGPNHLHGGIQGFSDKVWLIENVEDDVIELSLESPADEEGYPGTLSVQARYLLEDNTLELTLEAEVEEEATLVNLTNHVYWNLNGAGTIDDHRIQLLATAYTPKDETGIPTGFIVPVKGTDFDLTDEQILGDMNSPQHSSVADGYDHNFVLPTDKGVVGGVPVVASLVGGASAIELLVSTDAPGLQVYTGEYLPQSRAGVALEAQNFPDAINHPHFPTPILRPGELYSQTIAWTIE